MTRLFSGTPFDIPPSCDDCGKLESECVCTQEEKAKAEELRRRESERIPPDKQTARVSLQKRKGKRHVTVVEGLAARANDLTSILSRLQSVCGTGGTVKAKEDTIELQGDHADQVRSELQEIGYRIQR